MGLTHQKLGVLQLGQTLQKLLVFAGLGVGLLYLLQGEASAVQLHGIGLIERLQTVQFCLGILCSRKRCTVFPMRLGNIIFAPFVQQRALVRRGKQALVLVLAAQIHALPHCLRKLFERGKRTVERGPGAALGGDAPRGNHAFLIGAVQEESAFHLQLWCILPHQTSLCALPDKQFQGIQQSRLARARFTGDNGKARTGGKRSLGNQGNVLDMNLIDHANPLLAKTALRRRASRFDSTTWFCKGM